MQVTGDTVLATPTEFQQNSDVRPTVTVTAAQEAEITEILKHKEANQGHFGDITIQNVYKQVLQGQTFESYMKWFNARHQNIGPGVVPPDELNPSKRKDRSPEINPARKVTCLSNDDA